MILRVNSDSEVENLIKVFISAYSGTNRSNIYRCLSNKLRAIRDIASKSIFFQNYSVSPIVYYNCSKYEFS